jgi:hypothetical protein
MSDFLIVRPFAVEPGTEFSRASVATYYDADGVLQTAAIDEPRYAYDPETGDFEGLLIEEQRTNLFTYSEQFDNSAWTKTNVTITANAEVAPDGTTTADKIVENNATGIHHLWHTGRNVASGSTYTFSLFVKKSERNVLIRLDNISASSTWNGVTPTVIFDFATESITVNNGSINSGFIPYPNGWYRLYVTGVATATTNTSPNILLVSGTSAGSANYEGDGTSGLFIWGAQLEEGAFPTSYIKTEASQVTRAADIQGDGLTSNVAEDDYDEWDVGTTYALGDRVMIISGGSPEAEVHNVYESLIDSNTGNDPLDDAQFHDGDPTNWILVGKTNRWKMFDQSNSSQTVNADSIDVALKVSRRPNSLALLNVECSEIQVTQVNASGTIVYQKTFQMIESSGQPSYYGWFFQQIQLRSDLFIRDLPPVAGSTISIRIMNRGGDAKCGTCLVGYAEEFGSTQLGAEVGIQDFSVKRQNEFGDYQIRERAYSRVGRFPVFVPNSVIDRMQNLLAERRATATLYVAAEDYRCTYIYGFYEDMANVIQYNDYSLFNIRAIGLT